MFRDATPGNLRTAAEDHLYAALEVLGNLPQAEMRRTQHLFRYRVPGILSPMFNAVGRAQIGEHEADGIIAETIDYYRDAHTPYWFWWTGDQSQPLDLGERLVEHGLIAYEVNAPAMAVDLAALSETTAAPPGYRYSIVETESDLRIWVDTFMAAYEVPSFAAEAWYEASMRVDPRNTVWRLYTGWLNKEPVAISMLFPAAGIAGILAVATLPSVRGQGIGTAITLQPLIDAHAGGYKLGALFSSEMGLSVYRKIGFVQYGTISRYLWRAG